MNVDKREIYRYLGYQGRVPDENVLREVDRCLEELREAVTPRFVYRQYPIERFFTDNIEKPFLDEKPGAELLSIAGMKIQSRSLCRNLRDCKSAYLMAATLGIGPDRLIARASVAKMSRAVILQAAAAAMIEAWCDEVNQKIIKEAEDQGLYCRPRFSPGYGDFSLEYQKDFAQILRIQKEIGVSLTQSLLMMPSKSVTAVIGLSPVKKECALHGCEVCSKAEQCSFSRIKALEQQP
ncbi:MAG: Vitamin B12 dependent methionine synthase activation subunit [Sarcina sp.]|nr:Vitamin B12 dependent methionine synthase activation subunit [Sarcina sp.]